jgi:hypothetical protein
VRRGNDLSFGRDAVLERHGQLCQTLNMRMDRTTESGRVRSRPPLGFRLPKT